MDPVVLYAMPGSLYSGKARSYLRKHRIDYVERAPGDPRYTDQVVPAIGRWIIPVLETPDGTLVQDTVDIIDHLDAGVDPDRSAYPATPVHRAVAHLLELFGGEGLLRPAMHYRWDFDETNVAFLAKDFSASLVVGGDDDTRDAVFAFSSDRMRSATTAFGVSEELVPEIERSYEQFLDLFDAHLAGSPVPARGTAHHRRLRVHGPDLRPPRPRPLPLGADEAPGPARVAVGGADERARCWTPASTATAPRSCSPTTRCPTPCSALLAYIGEEFLDEAVAQVASVDALAGRASRGGRRARWCSASPTAGSAAPPRSPGGAVR